MTDAERQALIAEIAASRAGLADAANRLAGAARKKLNMPARIGASFRRNRPAWLGCAALLGFILSRLPAREKRIYVDEVTGRRIGMVSKLGVLWSVAKVVFGAAKPWLGDFAGKSIADLLSRMTRRPAPPAARDE